MLAGIWSPIRPMRTDPVSIATPPADRSDGSHYPETVLQTPSATSVQMYTGRGSGWISTGGRFSQHVPSSSNPAKSKCALVVSVGTHRHEPVPRCEGVRSTEGERASLTCINVVVSGKTALYETRKSQSERLNTDYGTVLRDMAAKKGVKFLQTNFHRGSLIL